MLPGVLWTDLVKMIVVTFVGLSIFLFFAFELKGGSSILELLLWPIAYLQDLQMRKKHPHRADPLPSPEASVGHFLQNVKTAILLSAAANILCWGLLFLVYWLVSIGVLNERSFCKFGGFC